jgi:Bacterial PH domain
VQRVQWSPAPAATGVLWTGAAVLGVAAVLLDTAGGLLVGTAAVGLLGAGVHDLLVRPRLAADAEGVVVRTWTGRRRLPWEGLRVAVRVTRRFGVPTRSLELDTAMGPDDAGDLVLLGRRELGSAPEDVAQALRALAAGQRPPRA